jgi:hypothetical protein
MSKRSRNASFLPESDECLAPSVEEERVASEAHSPPTKYSETDADAIAIHPARVVHCTLAPHREIACFDAQEGYEIHYAKEHANRCTTCSKNFPTARVLELHIEENHSALQEVLAARGEKTYGCFVEDCNRKCSTPQKRRLHMIDKHLFPKTYNFRIVDQGIDETSSMLRESRKRRVSTANDSHRADRYRRQALIQLRHRLANLSEGKINQPATINETENSAAKLEPRQTDAPNRATVPDQISKGGGVDLDSLTWSLSTLRFMPTSVLRKRKEKSAHLDNRPSEGKILCVDSP